MKSNISLRLSENEFFKSIQSQNQEKMATKKTTTTTTTISTSNGPTFREVKAEKDSLSAVSTPKKKSEKKSEKTKKSDTPAKKRTREEPVSEAVSSALAAVKTLDDEALEKLKELLDEADQTAKIDQLLKDYKDMTPEEQEAFQKEVKSSKKSNKKLPDQPKAPRTGWSFFIKEAHTAFKEEHPDMDQRTLMKELGLIWGQMTDEEKAPYQEKALEDAKTRGPLLLEFKKQHPEAFDANGKRIAVQEEGDGKSGKKKRKTKKEKDPNAPKGAQSSYFHYASHARKEGWFADVRGRGEFQKACSSQWNSLSDAEKAPFVKLAADDKGRFDAEKAAYDAKKAAYIVNEAPTQALSEDSSEEPSSSDEDEDE